MVGTPRERLLLGSEADDIVMRCNAHSAMAGNNHFLFLLRFYPPRRSVLMQALDSLDLHATSQDTAVVDALAFMLTHREKRRPKLTVVEDSRPLLDLSFVVDKWWPLVTGQRSRDKAVTEVDRRYFELCLLHQIMLELKSGDLYVPGGDEFSDYRRQLISWDTYEHEITAYGEQAGVPIEGQAFIARLQTDLEDAACRTDAGFPANADLRIENGIPILKRLRAKPDVDGARQLKRLLDGAIEPINIIDALIDTEYWLRWTRHFGPLSGFEAKLDDPAERYLVTTFCYGCNLGPTQTARSIPGLDRRQLAFVNQRHVSEEKLNEAITTVINAYTRVGLQARWGSGQTASADGTQWELYPQNLISQYHIRYGGYGGLGYYLIADSYVALFSRFIACGIYEGYYILDFINENQSDVRPETLHSDTHGQSETIFGLAYLLGIQLMPRIKDWKHLHFYRPSPDARYRHIDALFTAQIDWALIEALLPDMLRVAVSVKLGHITPSTILRRLGTHSRKNKLYFAFRELGRVVRTIFLLRYISEHDLRRQIQRATNKSEAFNKFAQWVLFGGGGVIAENLRDEQRKIIKYNHLIANLLIFHNLVTLDRALAKLRTDGHAINDAAVDDLSLYQTEHLNRFGTYPVNMDRTPEPLNLELP